MRLLARISGRREARAAGSSAFLCPRRARKQQPARGYSNGERLSRKLERLYESYKCDFGRRCVRSPPGQSDLMATEMTWSGVADLSSVHKIGPGFVRVRQPRDNREVEAALGRIAQRVARPGAVTRSLVAPGGSVELGPIVEQVISIRHSGTGERRG